MFAIEINKNKFAVGLKWSRLPGEKVRAEATAISKEMSLSYGMTRKLEESENNYIYQVGLSGEKSVSGMIPAAAIIADLVENTIFIQKLSDDHYWVCCILDSEVVPGGDIVVSKDALQDKFYEFQSIFEQGEVRYCADVSVHHLFGGSLDSAQFENILEEFGIDKPQKTFQHYKITSFNGIPLPLAMFTGLIFVGGIAFYLSTQSSGPVIVPMEDINIPEVVIKKDPVQEIKPAAPTEEEILKKAYEQEVSWFAEEFKNNNPHQIIKVVSDFAYSLPRHYAGWNAKQITYDVTSPQTLTVEWVKDELGTTLSLRETIKNIEGISFTLDGKNSITRHAVKGISPRVVGENIIEGIAADKYKNAELMHDLETMGLNWKVDIFTNDSPRPELIQGLPSNEQASKRQLRMTGKTFAVKGNILESIYLFGDIFLKSKSSSVNTVIINVKDNNWTVNGVLYEK